MSTLVSTFELLYARQIANNPADPGAAINAVSRRVLQAYFLTIANLANKQIVFQVNLRLTPATDPVGVPLAVKRVGNTISPPAFVTATSVSGEYFTRVTIPAGQTGLVGVFPPSLALPNIFNLADGNYQARGYAGISVPALFKPLGYIAQSNAPVNVLVTPDLRATFLPNEFPTTTTNLDFDPTMTSLPVASGGAALSIPPDPSRPVIFDDRISRERFSDLSLANEFLEASTPEERGVVLASLLSAVAADNESAEELSRALDAMGTSVSLRAKAAV